MDMLISCLLLDFGIQFVGFLVAYTLQTEKFYDLVGSLTYLLLIQFSLRSNPEVNDRQIILSTLASLWAVRLGVFLSCRVFATGGDGRFDKVKTNPTRFLIYWFIQGVWVFVTVLPVLLVNRTTRNNIFGTLDYIGVAVWILGFGLEVVADCQKFIFKFDSKTRETFISHGLWSISRHPNYLGEIILWTGCFVTASSAIQGWEWMSVLSPVFVYYLLTNVSGIPILEKGGIRKFGHLDTYKHYTSTVPVLVPFIGKT